MLRLKLLGGCSLSCGSDLLSGPAVQPRRLALLALAAGSRHKGLSRDRLTAYFWPEEDRERARHFLSDSLFTIRKSFGRDVFLVTATELRLNPERISADLWDFEDAVSHNDCAGALALYDGDFLDGFFVSDAPEFERWADMRRERLRKTCCDCVESLALSSEERNDYRKASEQWLDLSLRNPYCSRIAVRAMLALEKSGDPAAALRHAAKYERMIREDLEVPPDAEVIELAQRIRSAPSHGAKMIERKISVASQLDGRALTTSSSSFTIDQPLTRSGRLTKWRIIAATAVVAIAAAVVATAISYPEKVEVSPTAIGSFLNKSGSTSKRPRAPRQRAEELYHRARLVAASGMWPGPLEEPLDLFQDALRIDPTFAPAYAGMADLYDAHGKYDLAKQSALKALAIDSTLAEAYTALAGPLAYSEHRWWAADTALAKANRLNPRYKLGWMRRATIAAMQGRSEDALSYLDRAAALDPESWLTLDNTAIIKSQVGKLDEALEAFQQAMRLEPTRDDVKTLYGRTLWKAGRRLEAIDVFRASGAVVEAALAANDTSEMKELLDRYLSGELKVDPFRGAMLYLGLGNRDAAFVELRKSKHIIVPRLLKEPPLIWLGDDPRFAQILAQWNLLPQH